MVTVEFEERLYQLLQESSSIYKNKGGYMYVGDMEHVTALFAKKLAGGQPSLLTLDELAILKQLERDNPVLKISSDNVTMYILRLTQTRSLTELVMDRLGISVDGIIKVVNETKPSSDPSETIIETSTYPRKTTLNSIQDWTGSVKQENHESLNTLAKRYEQQRRGKATETRETYSAGAVDHKLTAEDKDVGIRKWLETGKGPSLLKELLQIKRRVYNAITMVIMVLKEALSVTQFTFTTVKKISWKEWVTEIFRLMIWWVFAMNVLRVIYFITISTIYNTCRAYINTHDDSSVLKVQWWKEIQALEYGAYIFNNWLEDMIN